MITFLESLLTNLISESTTTECELCRICPIQAIDTVDSSDAHLPSRSIVTKVQSGTVQLRQALLKRIVHVLVEFRADRSE